MSSSSPSSSTLSVIDPSSSSKSQNISIMLPSKSRQTVSASSSIMTTQSSTKKMVTSNHSPRPSKKRERDEDLLTPPAQAKKLKRKLFTSPPPSSMKPSLPLGDPELVSKRMDRLKRKNAEVKEIDKILREAKEGRKEAVILSKKAMKKEQISANKLQSLNRGYEEGLRKTQLLVNEEQDIAIAIQKLQTREKEIKKEKEEIFEDCIHNYQAKHDKATGENNSDRFEMKTTQEAVKGHEENVAYASTLKNKTSSALQTYDGKDFFERELKVPFDYQSYRKFTQLGVLEIKRRMRNGGYPGAENIGLADNGKTIMWNDICTICKLEVPTKDSKISVADTEKKLARIHRNMLNDSDSDDELVEDFDSDNEEEDLVGDENEAPN